MRSFTAAFRSFAVRVRVSVNHVVAYGGAVFCLFFFLFRNHQYWLHVFTPIINSKPIFANCPFSFFCGLGFSTIRL